MNHTRKPLASLSLDLDNQWSYMKTHGDPGWEAFPSYLDVVVPRALSLLAERGLTITWFIVGQDAAIDANRGALASIADTGHEIGSHSFRHEPWLHLYDEAELEWEIATAEEHIARATGQVPRGFRGPGFSLSAATLHVLVRRGYRYDASTFPTFIGPLARAYYFMTTALTAEEAGRRRTLFGSWRDGVRPVAPYRWRSSAGELIEVPVTTLPILRLPIHLSYILYLSAAAPRVAIAYFRAALDLCRLTRTEPSILLHPLDFLGREDATGLSFFPAMGMAAEQKLAVVRRALEALTDRFTVVTVGHHAETVADRAHAVVEFDGGALPRVIHTLARSGGA
jgi:hypothetical protein